MNAHQSDKIRQSVRETYGRIARKSAQGRGTEAPSCCGQVQTIPLANVSERLGYSAEELAAAPEGADLGLGCGNPQAIADLQEGETVLDLGSGAGFDCFLAARQVGSSGWVIGVDMTSDMVSRARENAAKGDYANVDFRLGEIEHLPVADSTVDAIISNCVINLSTDKPAVYGEAFRVLKPGGRLAISDVVALRELSQKIREDLALYSGCVAGAATVAELKSLLGHLGFEQVRIEVKHKSRELIREWTGGSEIAEYVASATIKAIKPV